MYLKLKLKRTIFRRSKPIKSLETKLSEFLKCSANWALPNKARDALSRIYSSLPKKVGLNTTEPSRDANERSKLKDRAVWATIMTNCLCRAVNQSPIRRPKTDIGLLCKLKPALTTSIPTVQPAWRLHNAYYRNRPSLADVPFHSSPFAGWREIKYFFHGS